MNRGIAEAEQGSVDGALRDLAEAIRLDGTNTDALFNRGLLYGATGQFGDAIDDFTAVIRVKPNDPAPYKVRAEAQRQMGYLNKAIND